MVGMDHRVLLHFIINLIMNLIYFKQNFSYQRRKQNQKGYDLPKISQPLNVELGVEGSRCLGPPSICFPFFWM